MDRSAISGDLTMLDGGAVISGAAIAAIHVRLANPEPRGWLAWFLVVLLFLWLALTATGPFLYLARRFVMHRAHWPYPRTGDRLWILWGCPWVISAIVESALRPQASNPGRLEPIYVGSLGLGLFLATIIAVPILAARYLWGDSAGDRRSGGPTWTQWVGFALTTTWPIQCGVGLVLIG